MKRILILSWRLPYPLIDGVRIRIYNTAKYLRKHYQLDLLCLTQERFSERDIAELKKVFRKVDVLHVSLIACVLRCTRSLWNGLPLQVNFFLHKKFGDMVAERLTEYDLIMCNNTRTAEYVRHARRRKIIDLHDAFSMRYEREARRASGIRKWGAVFEQKKILRYETTIVSDFDHATIVSEIDRQYLIARGVHPGSLTTLNVAVRDDIAVDGRRENRKIISFLGKMSYGPNEDAVIWFAEHVFDRLREAVPDLWFYIVGATPTRNVLRLSKRPNVVVTGYVDNPFNVLDESLLVVAPIQAGAGLQNKILEAMLLAKAVVTTSVGAEGIDGTDGEHFVIANSPDDFLGRILELLRDPPRCERIGRAARGLIEAKYSWSSIARQYRGIIEDVLARKV